MFHFQFIDTEQRCENDKLAAARACNCALKKGQRSQQATALSPVTSKKTYLEAKERYFEHRQGLPKSLIFCWKSIQKCNALFEIQSIKSFIEEWPTNFIFGMKLDIDFDDFDAFFIHGEKCQALNCKSASKADGSSGKLLQLRGSAKKLMGVLSSLAQFTS